MRLLSNTATARQWRLAGLSTFVAGCALVSTVAAVMAELSRTTPAVPVVRHGFQAVVLASGSLVALAGFQVHLASRQTRKCEPERFRTWMPRLSVALYVLGFACICSIVAIQIATPGSGRR